MVALKHPTAFSATVSGNEPVRGVLKSLDSDDRRRVGDEIATAEFGWPVDTSLRHALGSEVNIELA